MKKSICFLTYQHHEKKLIQSLKYSEDYYCKYIIFPQSNYIKQELWGASIAGIDDVLSCIQESDILLITEGAEKRYENLPDYIEYADKLNKNIVFSRCYNRTSADLIKINVPVILINSLGSDLFHEQITVYLRDKLRIDIGNVAVFSTDDKLTFMDDVYCLNNMIQNTNLESVPEMMNRQIAEIVENKEIKCIIIEICEGVFNPYELNNTINSHILSCLTNMLSVDFMINILPLNLKSDNLYLQYKNILKDKFDLDVDFWVFDNIFWDTSKDPKRYTSILLSDSSKLSIYDSKEDVNVLRRMYSCIWDNLSVEPRFHCF